MKKSLIVVLTIVFLLAFNTYALAVTEEQQKEINQINQQILELKGKLIDKYVESGQMPPELGQQMKDRMKANTNGQPKTGNNPNLSKGSGGKCPFNNQNPQQSGSKSL